ncbi:MAG: hypothetical protein LRY73_12000 [Bacillus sp. (in: Bacteria)]|nr:hypothetical protein [Bacillus sp. (in: firmicutes)]
MKQFEDKDLEESFPFDTTLERFEKIKLDQDEKEDVYNKLSTSMTTGRKPEQFKTVLVPVLNVAIMALFLFVGGYLIFTNFLVDNRPAEPRELYKDLEEIISDKLGVQIYLPEHEKYSIDAVGIYYGPAFDENREMKRGNPVRAQIYYAKEPTELMDEEMIELMKQRGSELEEWIYQRYYMAETAFEISIHTMSLTIMDDSELMEIEGHSVEYILLERDHVDLHIFYVEMDGVVYSIDYRITEGMEENEAFTFIHTFLQQVNARQ